MKPERKKKAYNIKGLAAQGLVVGGGRRMDPGWQFHKVAINYLNDCDFSDSILDSKRKKNTIKFWKP